MQKSIAFIYILFVFHSLSNDLDLFGILTKSVIAGIVFSYNSYFNYLNIY